MALQSAFKFTNTTESENSVTPISLGVLENYAVERDTARQCALDNKTAPIDAMELVSYRSRDIARVDTDLNIQHPGPVKSGIQYSVMVQDTLVTTDTGDATFRVDEPIVAMLSVRHPKSGNISNELVSQVVIRLLSACMRADGTFRFDDLMRSAERPVVD
jgi:hypothetical protein